MTGYEILEVDEAIRRIQERDHILLPGEEQMDFEHEQAIIDLLRMGEITAALLPDGRIAFRPA